MKRKNKDFIFLLFKEEPEDLMEVQSGCELDESHCGGNHRLPWKHLLSLRLSSFLDVGNPATGDALSSDSFHATQKGVRP